jgi:hypothetical protein
MPPRLAHRRGRGVSVCHGYVEWDDPVEQPSARDSQDHHHPQALPATRAVSDGSPVARPWTPDWDAGAVAHPGCRLPAPGNAGITDRCYVHCSDLLVQIPHQLTDPDACPSRIPDIQSSLLRSGFAPAGARLRYRPAHRTFAETNSRASDNCIGRAFGRFWSLMTPASHSCVEVHVVLADGQKRLLGADESGRDRCPR